MSEVRLGRRGIVDDVVGLPRTCVDFVRDGGHHLFVAPVRKGRPRLEGLSRGTRAVVACGVTAYVVCLLVVVFGGPLRRALDLTADAGGSSTLSLPRGLLWVVVTLVTLSLALLQVGALHSPVWLRMVVLPVTVLGLLFVGTADSDANGGPTIGLAVAAVGAACVVGLQLARWGRAAVWWEFVGVLVVVALVMTVAYRSAQGNAAVFGLDAAPSFTSLLIFLLAQLAIPMTIVSGISAAEVGVSATIWSSTFIGERLSFLVVGGLAVATGIVRLRDSWTSAFIGPDGAGGAWGQVVGAVVVGAVVALLWVTLDRVADRAAAGSSHVDDVTSDVQSVALPVAVGLAITALPAVVVRIASQVIVSVDRDSPWPPRLNDVTDWLSSDRVLLVVRVAAGAAYVLGAVGLARRGRRGPAELLGVIGLLLLASYATQDGAVLASLGGWDDALDLVGVLTVLVVVVVRVVRSSLTPEFLGSALLLLLLTVLLTQRDFVSNPLSIVLGFAGVGFLLFGYVWNYITGAESSNGDSEHFPRESRTMLFTALNLFGVTALAWAALTRSTEFGADLGPFAALGDQVIGVPIIVAAFAACVAAALRGDHG